MAVTPAKNERNQHCQLKISRVSQRFASDKGLLMSVLSPVRSPMGTSYILQVSVVGGVETPCVDIFLAVPAPNQSRSVSDLASARWGGFTIWRASGGLSRAYPRWLVGLRCFDGLSEAVHVGQPREAGEPTTRARRCWRRLRIPLQMV